MSPLRIWGFFWQSSAKYMLHGFDMVIIWLVP